MNNYHKTSAFTLIEVLVAASILSVTVFGVYKLIGENTKLISNNEQYTFANTLFPTLQECIEHLGFDQFDDTIPDTYNFNFGVNGDECLIGTTPPIVLDGVEYTLSGTTSGDANRIDWDLEISADTIKSITKKYTQLP